MYNKTILITGVAGFIGSHLADWMLESGYHVIGLDNLSTGRLSNLACRSNAAFSFIECSVEDFDLNGLPSLAAVFHLAAQTSVPVSINSFISSSETNLRSAVRIIDFCRGRRIPFIYASSSAIYGNLQVGDDESLSLDLLSPYAVDKYALELYTHTVLGTAQVPNFGFRFFNVYGPRQDPSSDYSGVISIFTRRALFNEDLLVNGGHQTRDFVYVKDVVRVIATPLLHSMESKDFVCNVLTGRSISIDNLADLIINLSDSSSAKRYRPLSIEDPERSSGTISKMSRMPGVTLDTFTTLEDGLRETINYISEFET